jgi:hypothetical protein
MNRFQTGYAGRLIENEVAVKRFRRSAGIVAEPVIGRAFAVTR